MPFSRPGVAPFFLGILAGSILTLVTWDQLPYSSRMTALREAMGYLDNRTQRILCYVSLNEETRFYNTSREMAHSWGARCDKLLFFVEKKINFKDERFVRIPKQTRRRRQRTTKSIYILKYLYRHHYHDATWFLSLKDRNYVIMENLRHFLINKNPFYPVVFGRIFNSKMAMNYVDAESGFVVSKGALRTIGESRCGFPNTGLYRREELAFTRCLNCLGVRLGDTVDPQGQPRFHPYTAANIMHGSHGTINDDYFKKDPNIKIKAVNNSIAYQNLAYRSKVLLGNHSISFHGVKLWDMRLYQFYVYKVRAYGHFFKQHPKYGI